MSLPEDTKFSTFPERLYAFNIDFLVFLILVVPISLIISDDLIFWSVAIAIICVYHAGLESSTWQATLGKKYAKIVVVNDQGERLPFVHALLRIITKFLSLLLFFTGFFVIYVRRDRRGLHDILSKTYVVHRGYLDSRLGNSHN